MKNHYLCFVGLALAAASCGGGAPSAQSPSTQASPGSEAKLAAAVTGTQRTQEERARDNFRHPRETLEFFGVRENMSVVEL